MPTDKTKRSKPVPERFAKLSAGRLAALKRKWAALPPEWRAQARQRVLKGEARYMLDILDKTPAPKPKGEKR